MKTREQILDQVVRDACFDLVSDCTYQQMAQGNMPATFDRIKKDFKEIVSKSSDQSATSANSEIS